jgi:hypothetical protein
LLLQNLQQGLLDQSVDDARHAELSDSTVRLGDFDPLDRLRLVGSREQLRPNAWPVLTQVVSGVVDGHPIHASGTLVASNAFPRSYEILSVAHLLHRLFGPSRDSKLRGCDPMRLKVNDVCVGGQVRDRATVIQRKTGRPVQFEITEQTRAAIRDWLASAQLGNGQYLFPSRLRSQRHTYIRIVHRWVQRTGLDSSAYGTHSMRRTKGAQIYKKTGNLRTVQFLLGTPSSKPRFATSASKSTMRSASRSRSNSNLRRRVALLRAGPLPTRQRSSLQRRKCADAAVRENSQPS